VYRSRLKLFFINFRLNYLKLRFLIYGILRVAKSCEVRTEEAFNGCRVAASNVRLTRFRSTLGDREIQVRTELVFEEERRKC
jgi:hypothetical protein